MVCPTIDGVPRKTGAPRVLRRPLPDHDQLVGIAVRQRPKERRIDQAEDSRRRPDPQTEYAHRRGGKPWRLVNEADGLTEVVWRRHAA